MKIKESLNVTFDETPPPYKTSPLVDDDLDEEETIKVTEKKNLENDIEDETLEIDEVVNIKESRNRPLENVIGNLKQRTLRSKAQNQRTKWVFRNKLDENGVVSRNKDRLVAQGYNQQEGIDYDETYFPVSSLINKEVYVAQPPGFIDFEKSNHVYKLKKDLYGLEQAPKAWYDRLKAFLIKHEYKMGMVDNILFTKKKSSNLIIVQIYVDDIIFGLTCQDMCDEFAKIMHDEFEMSMMGELNFFLGLQIKQMEDGIFFNQSKYIKEMLKKFGLEDSKPMKTPMSSVTKLTKDEECESVDSTKYRGMIGTTHLGLWCPKGTGIETIVYANSDHAGDYVDRKSTSGICTFVGCCLTSWFSKKQTDLAISTTEAEYVSTKKACQQALWMKQALIDYDILLDDVPIMCNHKERISLSEKSHFVVHFIIQNKSFSFTLKEFGHILGIPFKGHCLYSDKWSLDYLEISTPTKGRYQTTPPSPSVIKTLIQTPRQGQITRVHNKKTINVDENEILNREIQYHMSSWVEIIRENVLCLGGHRDHVLAFLCHMLYCIETSTKYNLAFFILKRMESIRNSPKANLPYEMLLTRLFSHIVSNFPELSNDRYILCDRVMHPLAPHYERKT
ncbi:retrovirus-related pol polyprotein from transposon TNT 1-94 [Tanacetum coccineum]